MNTLTDTKYVRYSPDVEQLLPHEADTIEELSETAVGTQKKVLQKSGSAKHGTHAKATGLIKGELIVADDLPPELAQGLFAQSGRYQVLIRFAQGPSEDLSDKASGQRGMSIKVLGVQGAHIAESRETTTQDWVLAPDPAFVNTDAHKFLESFKYGASKAPWVPEEAIIEGSRLARAAEGALEMFGLGNGNVRFFGRPPLHPASDTYYSQAPVRYGDYIAKIGAFPSAQTLDKIGDTAIDTSHDDNAFRTAMVNYFAENEAEYELRAQLCTDLETMPIENAAIPWPEDQSPYRTVARVVIPKQSAYNEERRLYFDQRLAFNPGHALEAHRPLGSVMRARIKVYEATQDFRQHSNQAAPAEPSSHAEVPN